MNLLRRDLFGLNAEEMAEVLTPLHVPAYRARQICAWLYQKHVQSFAAMTNLPQVLRMKLDANYTLTSAQEIDRLDSEDQSTHKFLLQLADGASIETVLMRHPYGNSVCVSTQVGCAMGCAFCASTLHGKVRDLTAAEMLLQVAHAARFLQTEGTEVSHVVLMGAGEPLLNYAEVLKFLHRLHAPLFYGISYRHMTLSTSGIVPQIKQLAQEDLPITLAISLHAADNALRSQLMPINRQYPLTEVLQAAKDYATVTGRRVTYEYILIAGLNDRREDADALASLLKGSLANVNVIPINPVAERGWQRPSPQRIQAFLMRLQKGHIHATARHEMGTDIQAACGQLRARHFSERP